MACRLYNTERCLQLQLFNRPNFGVHFNVKSVPFAMVKKCLFQQELEKADVADALVVCIFCNIVSYNHNLPETIVNFEK